MGPNILHRLRYVATVVFLTLHVTSSAKTNSRPVYEVINEQSKADDRQINTGKTNLPYGNPLAGNSHTNALLHAHNQQAMFNAERVRQHKAQLQRWTKTPLTHADSYMRAYHESQENHQLAQEQQQEKVEETTKAPRQRVPTKKTKQLDPVSLSKEEGGKERTRNHRSYGSVEYQHVEPRYHALYYPLAYSQNAIKPNTVNEMVHSPTSKLYTGVALNADRIYPKYYPAQEYQSIQNIETLNSLLNKNPGDQLTEFNALINSAKANPNHDKELETPIDLYFYLKDPSSKGQEHYSHISNVRAHTPVKEEVEEGDESKTIGFRDHTYTHTSQLDPTASKNIQYINSELTNQILSTGYNPLFQEEHSVKEEVEPEHQALQYAQQVTTYNDVGDTDSDLSERYLHHNGVQHLNDDGIGVSAYDEDNVSIDSNSITKSKNSRSERSVIETDQFVSTGNHSKEVTEFNDTQIPIAEPLIRIRSAPKNKRFSDFGTFLTTPNFAIGEAVEHNEAYPLTKPSRHFGASEIFYDEHDYENDDDFTTNYDYDNTDTMPQRNHFIDTSETYAPSETYIQNVKLNSKFTNQRPRKRIPNLNSVLSTSSSSVYGSPHSQRISSIYDSDDFAIPSLTYGPPNPTSTYGVPNSFSHSVDTSFSPSSPHLAEPVYLLTQSQLAKLVGHHNLNIEHLDVYQLSKSKRPNHYPRRYKKRSPHRNKDIRKNILKLHKLHII